jgi:hypothetical protein
MAEERAAEVPQKAPASGTASNRETLIAFVILIAVFAALFALALVLLVGARLIWDPPFPRSDL